MWEDFRNSAAFTLAAALAVIAAVAYFLLAPAPPVERRFGGIRGRGGPPEPVWVEWRTPEFYASAASLDRAEPQRVLRAVFEAHRKDDYARALAYGTDARQRRFSPDIMRWRFSRVPALSRSASLTIAEPLRVGLRCALRFRSESAEGEAYHASALMVKTPGGWLLEAIMEGELPRPLRAEPEARLRARMVAPPPRIFSVSNETSSARALADEFVVALLAGDTTTMEALSASPAPTRPDRRGARWAWRLWHHDLILADDARILRVDEQGDAARVWIGAEYRAQCRLYTLDCANLGEGAAPRWRIAAIRPMR